MDSARLRLAVPDDPDFIGRLVTALSVQGDPPISMAREKTVLAFECATAEMMLRSRVVQALQAAAGDEWAGLVEPVD